MTNWREGEFAETGSLRYSRAMKFCLALMLCVPATFGQLGPCATAIGPDLPDLIVNRPTLRASKSLTVELIETNDCQLVEGCVNASGQRRLLRFTTNTPNIGRAALVIGDPSQCDLLFHFSECHGHYHLEQYADYRLWKRAGFKFWRRHRDWSAPVSSAENTGLLQNLEASGDLIAGRKQGFCMVDSSLYPSQQENPPARVFDNCSDNQGISGGWSDDYLSVLACQFIDLTDAAPGRYFLEVEVNPDRVLPESDYGNNSSHIGVRIPAIALSGR